ncbi:hypothetical protein OIU78_029176 [Salix suchowensis]|nr:hypothetical protein OIU78_029176 [Salix suchowensis]
MKIVLRLPLRHLPLRHLHLHLHLPHLHLRHLRLLHRHPLPHVVPLRLRHRHPLPHVVPLRLLHRHPPPPRRSPPPPSPPPPPPRRSPPPPPPPPPPPRDFLNDNLRRDLRTIRRFKKLITGDPLGITKKWRGNDVCNFPGFKCATVPDKKVKALAAADFNGYNFSGPNLKLTGFLDELRDLCIYHANSNKFLGAVPLDISTSRIRYLFELDISNNNHFGEFPRSVLQATNLTFLDIRFNTFSGPVPAEVFNLDLDVLFINNNKFSQQLPKNLGSTPALYLTLANNKFSGRIPRSVGSARNLLEVLFLNNELEGCLPYEIGKLNKAVVFDVGGNKLTGPIPHSFACLEKMDRLNLAVNEFYGPVPEMVCDLPRLTNLSLSHNYFTQVGPMCMKLIKKKILDVRMNCILGLPGQRSAAECAKFFSKHKPCPNARSLSYIPCRKGGFSRSSLTSDQQSMAPAAAPITYDALIPRKHKLLL